MGRVDGKAVMETIGTIAKVPKIETAREKARAALLQMKAGTKPLEERRADKAQRAAEVAQAKAEAKQMIDGQFAVVAERFLREFGQSKGWAPKYRAEFDRILRHDVLPAWGEQPIRSISKHDVNELLDAKASRRERHYKGKREGVAVQSNKMLARLRTVFAWALQTELIDRDPTAGVLKRAKEVARDRFLSEDELIWFWRGAECAGWPFSPIFKLLLLTAQREAEVAGMRWSEVYLDKKVWVIPAQRNKSHREHVVHLSDLAVEVLSAVPRIDKGALVFPNRAGNAVTSFGAGKDRLDAAMLEQLRAAKADADLAPWVLHDLRRTATTIMAEKLKVAPHVADKILNHSSGTIRGVAAVYNRSAYLEERQVALGRYFAGLVRAGGAGNVAELAKARV